MMLSGWYVRATYHEFPYRQRLESGPLPFEQVEAERRRLVALYPDADLDTHLWRGKVLPDRTPRALAPDAGWSGPFRVAATGHRWSRLPFPRTVDAERKLQAVAVAFLQQMAPDEAISGLALGWDTAFAQAAVQLRIPLVAALPGKRGEQTRRWNWGDEGTHDWLVRQAAEVHCIGEGYAFGRACVLRDKWMADRGHVIAALWSGHPSGTGTTVRFAEKQQKPVVNLWDLMETDL